MLSVIRVHLPSFNPVVGCDLTPFVLVRRPDKTAASNDVPESAPLEGYFLRYRWYRVQGDKKETICSVHPTEEATLQCIFCSPKCFNHRTLHERAAAENGNDDDEEVCFNSGVLAGSLSNLNLAATPFYPSNITQKNGGETLVEVGTCKTYTPTADDFGYVLKFECVVANAETKQSLGHPSTILTSRVISAPSPSPRRLVPVTVNGAHVDQDGRVQSEGSFTVLSYNILSDFSASGDLYYSYSYCPPWALSWPYRRQNLLREIVGYQADVVCLQEVQIDHFHEFFAPELDKHGYQALYKRKTNEVLCGSDGCATFFRRDRFTLVKKYDVEFNKAAQSFTKAITPPAQQRTALDRLLKDNIALIVVLEAKFGNQPADPSAKRQLICVANTHVNVEQDLKDVKLWQIHTLLKGLEKIANRAADIPMLVCGDFNTLPGSAAHSLLVMGKVDPLHLDLFVDPLRILRPHTKLTHQLPLVSAYSSFVRPQTGMGLGLEQHRRRMDLNTKEPLFTNCTGDFIGTHDYIFYTADTLTVESLLELLDEDGLRKDKALPSPEWSSNHIALLAQFRCA